MIGDISLADNIYLITGYTDMRRSIDGLYAIVVDKLNAEPDRRSIYLFCGKRSDRIKILIRENDGYVLLYKRLDSNIKGRFRWPRTPDEVKSITWKQLDWLMSGLEIEQPKAIKAPWFLEAQIVLNACKYWIFQHLALFLNPYIWYNICEKTKE